MSAEIAAPMPGATASSDLRTTGLTLFLVGFLVLFLELACIRWFAAYVIFLQFFTNVVLLASFLGMSCGCMAARKRYDWLGQFPALALFTVTAALVMLAIYQGWTGLADRCRAPVLATGSLLRYRIPQSRRGPIRHPDRADRGDFLPPDQPAVRRAGAGPRQGVRRLSQPCRRLYAEHRRQPRGHRRLHRHVALLGAPGSLVPGGGRRHGLPAAPASDALGQARHHPGNARADGRGAGCLDGDAGRSLAVVAVLCGPPRLQRTDHGEHHRPSDDGSVRAGRFHLLADPPAATGDRR